MLCIACQASSLLEHLATSCTQALTITLRSAVLKLDIYLAMEMIYSSLTSQSLNPTPSLSLPLPLYNDTFALLTDIAINSTNSTNSTGDKPYLRGGTRVYLWTLVLLIPLMLFMLSLDCLECLPWHKKKRKESERGSQSASFSSLASPPQNSSITTMDSRSTPSQPSERSSKVRFVTPGELEAQQASWERLELNLPGSRISLPLTPRGERD